MGNDTFKLVLRRYGSLSFNIFIGMRKIIDKIGEVCEALINLIRPIQNIILILETLEKKSVHMISKEPRNDMLFFRGPLPTGYKVSLVSTQSLYS